MRYLNSIKIFAAWLIVMGIISLALGVVGLQFRLLFLLDEFGPFPAYALKFGLIVLGLWIWRRDGLVQVDRNPTDEESRRAWIPVIVAAAVIVGIAGFIVTSELKSWRLERQLQRLPPAATWAGRSAKQWPTLVLLQKAKFAHHSSLDGGCACLVRLPTGEIVALTAGHLLGRAGGVDPGFVHVPFGGLDTEKLATLDSEITSWRLFLPYAEDETNDTETIKLAGLYGKASQWNDGCDQVLLRLAPGQTNYPATPLDLRLTPVSANETLQVATYSWNRDGDLLQVVHTAHRMPGLIFQCKLDEPDDFTGASGAPVLDQNGLLVGIVTGGALMDSGNQFGMVRAFSARATSELMPVLKPAVDRKGMARLSPMEAVFNAPIRIKEEDHHGPIATSF